MKKYLKPIMNIVKFSVEDIITASGTGIVVNASDLTGEDENMYDIYQESSSAKNTNVSVFTW